MKEQEESSKETRNYGNSGILRSRPASSIRKGYAKIKARVKTVRSIPSLRGFGSPDVHSGPFKIEISIHGKCRGDIDNILKGVLDALNGVAYVDDRQCKSALVYKDSDNNIDTISIKEDRLPF